MSDPSSHPYGCKCGCTYQPVEPAPAVVPRPCPSSGGGKTGWLREQFLRPAPAPPAAAPPLCACGHPGNAHDAQGKCWACSGDVPCRCVTGQPAPPAAAPAAEANRKARDTFCADAEELRAELAQARNYSDGFERTSHALLAERDAALARVTALEERIKSLITRWMRHAANPRVSAHSAMAYEMCAQDLKAALSRLVEQEKKP